MVRLLAALFAWLNTLHVARALENGQGLMPPMGYSSRSDCSTEVTEWRIKNVTLSLIETGLAAKGYVYVNIDEGWLAGRNVTTGKIYANPHKFPSGIKALADWVHDQVVPGKGNIMKIGLYTSRGTCQCSTNTYHGPGSQWHVSEDAHWLGYAGMDYLKEESCCSSQNHSVAIREYENMRDALDATTRFTNRSVFFSVCGRGSWYAPVGASLGNSWCVAKHGSHWGALSNSINENAALWNFSRPGAWNDPDLLQGTGVGSNDLPQNPRGCYDPRQAPHTHDWYVTEEQSRAQFSMWAVMSAPLLISADVGQVSQYSLETWGNEEVIAVSQSFVRGGPYQGQRLFGEDLKFDKRSAKGKGVNVWGKKLPCGSFALVFINNNNEASDVLCDMWCFEQMVEADVTQYSMRDLWARNNTGTLKKPFSYTALQVPKHGGVVMLRFKVISTWPVREVSPHTKYRIGRRCDSTVGEV
ncbi:hypothetical protein CYMTET_45712 [Cymbomonas tetramitiformis]|uniref:Alpha-galactosidase n=1 Tax=Cymbomonas tetramitiformis TaxID=36881 RepID=A0AAE0BZ19_9CHLO|nr:hypothetical protein CYMTET_45712 [Cymbomonas tetramitiformis]